MSGGAAQETATRVTGTVGDDVDVPSAVLFACSMNAIRSPMAAATLSHLAGSRIYVASAGVRAGEPDGFAIAVMNEIGIDISKHQPHTLDDLNDTSFDLIISLSPEAHHQALELTRTMAVDVEYWPTLDPSLMNHEGRRDDVLMYYRQARDQLFAKIKQRFRLEGGPSI
ncbi:MAG: low molecular weight phosphatase family protein [Pseudomonadota bacterium]